MAKTKTIKLNWNFLLDKIQEEQCILVLGPGIFDEIEYKDNNVVLKSTIQERLLQSLKDNSDEIHFHKYYDNDDFFLFESEYMRTLTCHQIKQFYGKQPENELLNKISEIPFHVILTITPDKALHQTFDRKGLSYQEGFYKKNKDPQPIRKSISKSNPVIYNVFGTIDNEESMVLTHSDLYDFFKSIFKKDSTPKKLKEKLLDAKNFLFLGVEFDKWYMQLLLRELEIDNEQYAFTRFAANQIKNDKISTFCLEQFHINFIEHNITDFVENLHQKSKDLDMIRTADSLNDSPIKKIQSLVAKAQFQDAIDMLQELGEETELENDILQLSGRFRKHLRKVTQGVLYEDTKAVDENRIIKAILDLATKLEAIL